MVVESKNFRAFGRQITLEETMRGSRRKYRALWGYNTGIGGITATELMAELLMPVLMAELSIPESHYPPVYCFIDPEFAPYGPKSDTVVKSRTVSFVRFAHEVLPNPSYGIVACNTASTILDDVRHYFDPHKGEVISVIDPILRELRRLGGIHTRMLAHAIDNEDDDIHSEFYIAVFGTVRTINKSRYYQTRLENGELPNATIIGIACPRLASLIDQRKSEEVVYKYVKKYVSEILQHKDENNSKIDINNSEIYVVLACTHFERVRTLFERAFKEHGVEKPPVILNQHKLALGYVQDQVQNKFYPPRRKKKGIRLIVYTTGKKNETCEMIEEVIENRRKELAGNAGRLPLTMDNVEVRCIDLPYQRLDTARTHKRTSHSRTQESTGNIITPPSEIWTPEAELAVMPQELWLPNSAREIGSPEKSRIWTPGSPAL